MVKKPVAKKEKKKSARQLQVELDKKKLQAFNSAVAGVRDIFAKVKYKKTKPPKTVYLKGGNDKKKRDLWRINGTQIKPSMKIMFRTNSQRHLVLKHLKEFSDRTFNTTWTTERKLSSLGHLMFNVKYMFPDKIRNNEIVEVQKIITFHVVVKYDDDKAFKDLPYGNDLLDRTVGSLIKQRKPDTSLEQQILYEINTKLEELGSGAPVDLKIQGDTTKYEKIIGFIPGSSGVHADFVGIDGDGEEKCFISHKDGQRAKDFQQYSGISSKAGDTIHLHEETKKFREIIASKNEQDFDNQSFSQDIVKRNLKVRAVLGPDWQSGGDPGHNSVSHFMQGKVKVSLVKSKGEATDKALLRLSFNHKNIKASSIGSLIKSTDYEPTLGARRGEDTRSVTFDSNEVRRVRGGIFSSAYIKGRRNNVDLSNPKQ